MQVKLGSNKYKLIVIEIVAGVTGLEPAASGVTGQRSNQLSYTPLKPSMYFYQLTHLNEFVS